MQISFILPSRNNLKYVQQAYRSIREANGFKHEVVLLDDASTDGTWEWMQNLRTQDDNLIIYRNEGPERVGHTILYDKGIQLSTKKAFSILHADMIVTPNYVANLIKHLKKGSVVCATRVEPPLHPPGPEKHVKLFGTEPEEFKKAEFETFVVEEESRSANQTTNGIFAPWCMYKEDFIGHDPLFAPMELEDSDIFNRFLLKGYDLIQSRDALVYHMTCRGSRFKDGIEIEREIPLPDGTIWYKPKDSEEYLKLRQIKFREWWRKWHQDVLHDELMMPIVRPVYDIAFKIFNASLPLVRALEPWCDRIYVDDFEKMGQRYIKEEQPNTLYYLDQRVFPIHKATDICADIIFTFDGAAFTQTDLEIVKNIPYLLQEATPGSYIVGDNARVVVNKIQDYAHSLIFTK